jgi:hypothetical protein
MTDASSNEPHDSLHGGGDDDIPPDAFLASFPWWVVATRLEAVGEEGAVRLGPESGFLVLDAADGSTSLAVFTDEDLAERFVAASGFAGRPVGIETPRRFTAVARHVPPVCTHVAFDPPARVGGRARWVVPLRQVLAAMEFAEPAPEEESE